jgi:diguanylate cyclase (GGDEF)-like protein
MIWFAGKWLGIVMSFVGACMWLAADVGSGHSYAHMAIPFWNSTIRFGFFVISTYLLSELRRSLEREKEMARTDQLTGAVNARYFFELAQMEIERLVRYKRPFTIAYLDLDNFKSVNDRLGHAEGDKVLIGIVDTIQDNLRRTDIVARFGGDEFVILLPETDDQAAHAVVSRMHRSLMEKMKEHLWTVTFSIGVVTCLDTHRSVDDLMKSADNLMYQVKNNGKNAVQYIIYKSEKEMTADHIPGQEKAADHETEKGMSPKSKEK